MARKKTKKLEEKQEEITLERAIGIGASFEPNWSGSSDLVIDFAKPEVFKGKNLSDLLIQLRKWEEHCYEWNFCKAPEPRYTYYQIKIYNPNRKLTHSQICSSPANEAWNLTRFDEAQARIY
ncbi:hypothetical protein FJZ17_02670 [Candidatus Pacearchaeota archaeon]|nr:hypothetical protein [Candidatus Pacearchaeota archaeon]